MKINLLSNKIGWFGKHSGYECLPAYFDAANHVTIHQPKYTLFNKLLGKYYKQRYGFNLRSEDVLAGMQFIHHIASHQVSHILYLENHLHLLDVGANNNAIVGTIHIPFAQWKMEHLLALKNLKHAIFLYQEEIDKFKPYLKNAAISVIRHGIDTGFFCPGTQQVNNRKLLFVGHFLRNFQMMEAVFNRLEAEEPDGLELHFVIPSHFRDNTHLQNLAAKPNVFFHEKLSDEELLELYQQSYLLVMPMNDSGANTAIIQALAVGLPIVTTLVGGIGTYGGNSIFPVVPQGNVDQMVQLVKKYFYNQAYRNEVSEMQRSFAKEQLNWPMVAGRHVEVYQQVASSKTEVAHQKNYHVVKPGKQAEAKYEL